MTFHRTPPRRGFNRQATGQMPVPDQPATIVPAPRRPRHDVAPASIEQKSDSVPTGRFLTLGS
jgi:hypothetical protein